MTSVLMGRRDLDTQLHTGRRPCEQEDRDQGDVSINQGTPKTASKPPGARGQILPHSRQEDTKPDAT